MIIGHAQWHLNLNFLHYSIQTRYRRNQSDTIKT